MSGFDEVMGDLFAAHRHGYALSLVWTFGVDIWGSGVDILGVDILSIPACFRFLGGLSTQVV